MAFDASPSWSGFNYQGKVALYYALVMINAEPVASDFSNRSLMLEDTEDFEILCNKSSVSIHQVKAYNSSVYSKYSNALLEITLELYKRPGVFGKIHTWKEVNPKKNFPDIESSIKDDLKFILDQYQNSNPKNGSTILENAASTDQHKPKISAILKVAFPSLSADQLFDTLNSICLGQNDAVARLESYLYEDNNRYCDLDTINEKIKLNISNALEARNIPVTKEQLEKKFHYFLGMMDAYIIQRHKTKRSEEKISITFDQIINILNVDHEDIGKDYLTYKFKENFSHLIDKYIADPEDYKEPEEDQLCNLKEVRKILLNLSPQELWAQYRSFCPHIYLEHENNTENAFNADAHGTRYVLINILHEMNFKRVSQNDSSYRLIYRTDSIPSRSYLPTTIANTARATQIERDITNNPSMSEILFEVENLIYKGEETHTFSPNLMAHTEAPRAVDEEPRSKRTEALKKIALVPIPIAKDALI